ncbi:histidine phosphatase family protein [Streptomyces sp. NPDC059134]|uniref:histidine phosphatase family protein n=1 Tax=Streptomyces sp. NPDC059134 TaxID=3346738 RepID=UPI00367CF6E5
MTIRVLLVSPAIGPALRAARFGEEPPEGRDPEAPGSGAVESGAVDAAGNSAATAGGRCAAQDNGAVDAAGVRQTEAVREDFLRTARTAALYVSPTPRCRATARLLGLDARPLPDLAPWAMGRWRGRTLDEVAAAEPQGVSAWLTDPAAAPHGGETLLALQARVGRWLDTLGQDTPRVVAVAEPDIVRAATVHALGTAAATFWRLDVRPLTATELTGRNGRWNLLSGRPLADGGAGEEN